MICGHVCLFLRMMPFCLCENQSSLVLIYNAPWHGMTYPFASSRFICGFGGGVFILCLELNLQLTRVVTANRHFISCYRVFPAVVSETFDLHVLILRMMRVEGHH